LEIRFELAPPSSRRPRFVGLGLPFFLWLGVSAALEFGSGLVGGGPDVPGAGGPSFISDAVGFKPLPFRRYALTWRRWSSQVKVPVEAQKSGLGAGPGHPEPRRERARNPGPSVKIMPLDS
jgi:hypothetical protein